MSNTRTKIQFFSTAGYHPHNAKEWDENSYTELQKLIKFENVRAVGMRPRF